MTKKIIHINKNCYACKTCEMICSFHHTGEFNPSKSSITVERDHLNGEWKWTLHDSCDLCENEPELLCIKFCKYNAIQLELEGEKSQ